MCSSRQVLGTQRAQPTAQRIGIDADRVADVAKRERGWIARNIEPRANFVEFVLPIWGGRAVRMIDVDTQSVLEHGECEPRLAVEHAAPACQVIKLNGQKLVRLKLCVEPRARCSIDLSELGGVMTAVLPVEVVHDFPNSAAASQSRFKSSGNWLMMSHASPF